MVYRRGDESDVGEGGGFSAIGESAESVASHAADYLALAPSCESPIEVMFGVAMAQHMRGKDTKLRLVPQWWWKNYRIDWALVKEDNTPICFVECDGAEFHTTEAQKRRDREKDAAAKTAGIEIFRFSGSDLFRSAEACAALVYSHVERKR